MRVNDVQNNEQPPTQIPDPLVQAQVRLPHHSQGLSVPSPTQTDRLYLCCLLAKVLEIVVVTGYQWITCTESLVRARRPTTTPRLRTLSILLISQRFPSLVANPTCCLSGRSSSNLSEDCTLLSEVCCCLTLQALGNCSLAESRRSLMAILLHAQASCLRDSLEGLVSPVPSGFSVCIFKIPHVPPAFNSVAVRQKSYRLTKFCPQEYQYPKAQNFVKIAGVYSAPSSPTCSQCLHS